MDRAAGVVCDAKSGVSGAGRKPSLKTSFCEVTENFSAYSILKHRHVPEVLLISGLEEREFSFTAQLLPLDRGILETIYFRAHGPKSAEELIGIYEKRYAGEPFVRLYHPGHVPDLRRVARTNFCDIGVIARPGHRTRGGGQRHRQPGEGRGGAGGPEHEPDARIPRNRGPAVKLLVKLGGTLLDSADSRGRAGRTDRRGSRAGCRTGGGPRRRQADDPLPGRARHREPVRQRTARDRPGDRGCGVEGLRGQREPRTGGEPEPGRARWRWGSPASTLCWWRPSRWIRRWARWAVYVKSNAGLLQTAGGERLSAGGRVRGRRPAGPGLQRQCRPDGGGLRRGFRRPAVDLSDRCGRRDGRRETGAAATDGGRERTVDRGTGSRPAACRPS